MSLKAADTPLSQTEVKGGGHHPGMCSICKFNLDKPAHIDPAFFMKRLAET